MNGAVSSKIIFEKIATTYKTIASPIHCPLCGAYPAELVSGIQPDRVFRCQYCGKDYTVKKNLDEKTIDQMINSILKDFSDVVTEEIRTNICEMIAFYHQKMVSEIEKQMQIQKVVTFDLIQNAYKTVDQHMSVLFLEIKNNLEKLSSQQTYLINKSQEQYQTLLQHTQLIVDLIRQLSLNSQHGKTSPIVADRPSRKLKHTEYNPEEFSSI